MLYLLDTLLTLLMGVLFGNIVVMVYGTPIYEGVVVVPQVSLCTSVLKIRKTGLIHLSLSTGLYKLVVAVTGMHMESNSCG